MQHGVGYPGLQCNLLLASSSSFATAPMGRCDSQSGGYAQSFQDSSSDRACIIASRNGSWIGTWAYFGLCAASYDYVRLQRRRKRRTCSARMLEPWSCPVLCVYCVRRVCRGRRCRHHRPSHGGRAYGVHRIQQIQQIRQMQHIQQIRNK